MKSLATAAMLASAIPAGAQTPQNGILPYGITEQISEVLTNEENSDNQNTLSAEEVQVRLQIEKQIRAIIKDKKLKELVDFYGEDRVKSRMYEMVDEIRKNRDKYGRFDSDGNFSISKDDGSLFFENECKSLCESKFVEYDKFDRNNEAAKALAESLGLCIVIMCAAAIYADKKINKLEQENEKLKIELRDTI